MMPSAFLEGGLFKMPFESKTANFLKTNVFVKERISHLFLFIKISFTMSENHLSIENNLLSIENLYISRNKQVINSSCIYIIDIKLYYLGKQI